MNGPAALVVSLHVQAAAITTSSDVHCDAHAKKLPVAHVHAQAALAKLLLFNRLDTAIQRKVVSEMFERTVPAGDILIKEGDTGVAASELYVVKEGKFEVSNCSSMASIDGTIAHVLFCSCCSCIAVMRAGD